MREAKHEKRKDTNNSTKERVYNYDCRLQEKMKLYDVVRKMLTDNPRLRDDDKELIWEYMKLTHNVSTKDGVEFITKVNFLDKSVNFESLRRVRQKIQEDHPELEASSNVKRARETKQKDGKYFVYHEGTPIFDNVNNIVRFDYGN